MLGLEALYQASAGGPLPSYLKAYEGFLESKRLLEQASGSLSLGHYCESLKSPKYYILFSIHVSRERLPGSPGLGGGFMHAHA